MSGPIPVAAPRSGGAAAKSTELTGPAIAAAFGAWLGFLVGPNAMVSSTNSNFLALLPDVLGVSRTAVSGAIAASVWGVAFLTPVAGRMMDRFGVRRVILPGVVFFGLCYLLLSQITSFWQFAMLQVALAGAIAMHSSVGYAKLLSLWFDRNRGVMLGLCVALGAGVGQTVMPKISLWLIQAYGWSGGYMGIGMIVLLIGFPAIFLLARPPAPKPQAMDVSVVAAEYETPGLTRAEALRQPAFYLIFFAIMLASMTLIGSLQHAVPMLLDHGVSMSLATTVLSCAFAGVVLGEFTTGFIVDRAQTPRVVLPYFTSGLIGLLILHSATGTVPLVAGAFLMGLGLGCEVGQNAYLVSRYFGLKSFGSIYGITFGASNFGIGVGILVMGWVRDLTGSYDLMRYLFGASMTVSVLCVACLGPFRFAPRGHGR